MATKKDLEDFIVSWNSKYKYDRRWRKKYNIPFGSKTHLEVSQIDIYLDICEDKIFEKAKLEYLESLRGKEEYEKTGRFLKEIKLSQEDEDKLFKKIKF